MDKQTRGPASGWAEGMSRFANASSDFLQTLDRTWFQQHAKQIVWGFLILLLTGPAIAIVALFMGWLP